MKHNSGHYISKFLGYLWYVTLIVGSVAMFIWVVRAFLKLIGVI